MVAWDTICRPTCFGGLGVINLRLQSLAFRVRWEWLRRTDPRRPWQGLSLMVDKDARLVFDSMVNISVGNGEKVLFWRDRWIHGFLVHDIAPLLATSVTTRVVNTRTVRQALLDEQWTLDIRHDGSFMALLQIMHLRHAIAMVHRDEGVPDIFTWPASASGVYTAKSTYQRMCHGLTRLPYISGIWWSWAPPPKV